MAQKDMFDYEADNCTFRVQWDSEGASGDDWDEPKTPARAWIHQIWIVNPTKPNEPILIDEDCLHAHTRETIEDLCCEHAFPDDDRED